MAELVPIQLPPPNLSPIQIANENMKSFNIYFYIGYAVLQIIIIFCFGGMKYPDGPYGTNDSYFFYDFRSMLIYQQKIFVDTGSIMLLGFGFLIVFLRFHRWMSLGLTLFAASISIQIYMLFGAFWFKVFNGGWSNGFTMTLFEIIAAERAAIAVIISMGALVGKVDAFQILVVSFIELIFFSFNEHLLFSGIKVRDMGGAFYIHTFASIFGAASSWIYSPKSNCIDNPNIAATYGTSTLTLLGTFFLWTLFPSFNCFNPWHKTQFFNTRYIAMANTFWALAGSTIVTFGCSMLYKRGRFSIENIQNSTLSGAVMIAACCDMFSFPFPALLIGCFAGVVSISCYEFLPNLLARIKYFDTRGILYLHFIPAFFGAIASSIACATLSQSFYGSGIQVENYLLFGRSAPSQGGFQFLGWFVSLLIGAASGAGTGLVLRIWRVFRLPIDTFGDHIWWKMINDSQLPPALPITSPIRNPISTINLPIPRSPQVITSINPQPIIRSPVVIIPARGSLNSSLPVA